MKIPIAVTHAISIRIETEPRIGCNRNCKHLYPLGKTRRSDRLLTWENSFHSNESELMHPLLETNAAVLQQPIFPSTYAATPERRRPASRLAPRMPLD